LNGIVFPPTEKLKSLGDAVEPDTIFTTRSSGSGCVVRYWKLALAEHSPALTLTV
jgi:hypothetical protein